MVVKAPARDVALTCGGVPVLELAAPDAPGGSVDPAHKQGTQMGKRYTNAADDVELLCTKPARAVSPSTAKPWWSRGRSRFRRPISPIDPVGKP